VIYQAGLGTYPLHEQNSVCALAWIHANADSYGFDTQQIVPVGFFGGLAAFLGTLDDPEQFMAECAYELPDGDLINGVVSVEGFFDYSIWIPGSQEGGEFYAYFGDPNEHMEDIRMASPVSWVDGSEPPFLLIHAEIDEIIDPSQSEMFAANLSESGVAVELIIPDINLGCDCSYDSIAPAMTSHKVFIPIKNFLAELFSR